VRAEYEEPSDSHPGREQAHDDPETNGAAASETDVRVALALWMSLEQEHCRPRLHVRAHDVKPESDLASRAPVTSLFYTRASVAPQFRCRPPLAAGRRLDNGLTGSIFGGRGSVLGLTAASFEDEDRVKSAVVR